VGIRLDSVKLCDIWQISTGCIYLENIRTLVTTVAYGKTWTKEKDEPGRMLLTDSSRPVQHSSQLCRTPDLPTEWQSCYNTHEPSVQQYSSHTDSTFQTAYTLCSTTGYMNSTCLIHKWCYTLQPVVQLAVALSLTLRPGRWHNKIFMLLLWINDVINISVMPCTSQLDGQALSCWQLLASM